MELADNYSKKFTFEEVDVNELYVDGWQIKLGIAIGVATLALT